MTRVVQALAMFGCLALGAVGYALYRVLGRKDDALRVRADATERAFLLELEGRRQRIDQLKSDIPANAREIVELQKQLDGAKAELGQRFEAQGLPADELVRRLARIKL